MIRVAYVTGDQ